MRQRVATARRMSSDWRCFYARTLFKDPKSLIFPVLSQITLIPEPKGKTPPAPATTHKPVTRSQTAAAAQNGISGDEVAYTGTPSSVKKTPRRKSVNGKAE